MRLIEKKWQSRRDFMGMYECENCNNREEIRGYDDDNFHINVTPKIKCKKCDKSTIDQGITPQNVKTKYERWMVI